MCIPRCFLRKARVLACESHGRVELPRNAARCAWRSSVSLIATRGPQSVYCAGAFRSVGRLFDILSRRSLVAYVTHPARALRHACSPLVLVRFGRVFGLSRNRPPSAALIAALHAGHLAVLWDHVKPTDVGVAAGALLRGGRAGEVDRVGEGQGSHVSHAPSRRSSPPPPSTAASRLRARPTEGACLGRGTIGGLALRWPSRPWAVVCDQTIFVVGPQDVALLHFELSLGAPHLRIDLTGSLRGPRRSTLAVSGPAGSHAWLISGPLLTNAAPRFDASASSALALFLRVGSWVAWWMLACAVAVAAAGGRESCPWATQRR